MIPVVPFLCKKVRLRLEECGCYESQTNSHEGFTQISGEQRHEAQPTSTKGFPRGGNRALHKDWGTHPQLNWRLPTNRHKGLESVQGSKNPRVTTSLLSPPRITVENSNRCTKCNGKKHHKDAQVLLSQIPTKLQKLVGNKRGRTRRRTPNYSKIQIHYVPLTQRGYGLVGLQIQISSLFSLKKMQDSLEGEGVEQAFEGQQWGQK